MKLPRCWSCEYSFKWRELYYGLGPKKCPNCGSEQYVTAQKRRQRAWAGPITVLFIFFLSQVLNLSFTVSLILGISLVIIVILLNPFLLEFTDKDEGIF